MTSSSENMFCSKSFPWNPKAVGVWVQLWCLELWLTHVSSLRSFGSLSCHGHTGWLRHCGHACSSSRQSQGKLLSMSNTSSGTPRIHNLVVIHLILMSSFIFKSHFTDNFKSPFSPDCVKGTPTGNFHKQNGEIWGGTMEELCFSTFDFPLIPSIFPMFSEVFPRFFHVFPRCGVSAQQRRSCRLCKPRWRAAVLQLEVEVRTHQPTSWGPFYIPVIGDHRSIPYTIVYPKHPSELLSSIPTNWHSIWHIFWHRCWHWHSVLLFIWHFFWAFFLSFHLAFYSTWHSIWHPFWHPIWHMF